MEELSSAFSGIIKNVCSNANVAAHITPENVYQEGNKNILPYLDQLIEALALPGSGFSGAENLHELWKKSQAGASCLILSEHYSNSDLPGFFYYLKKALPQGEAVANDIISIAGRKMNEENPAIAAFASAYSRIVICPSRELPLVDGKKDEEERLRVIQINRTALLTMNRLKRGRKMILVFPAGTRYRPWDPASKRGVREMDSYIRTFDYMCLVSINGVLLAVRKGEMINDFVQQDVLRYTASPVLSCADFRHKAKVGAENAGSEDVKQAVVDALMAKLEAFHNEAEIERQKITGA
jgi:glycerol-3-phosphate O-acyltransferase